MLIDTDRVPVGEGRGQALGLQGTSALRQRIYLHRVPTLKLFSATLIPRSVLALLDKRPLVV